jgi:hypothetical protein
MTAPNHDTINELIDRLVAEGRATRQRGKIVVWVADWGSLTREEQAMIRVARQFGIRPRPPAPKPLTASQREAAAKRSETQREAAAKRAAAQREAAAKRAETARINRKRRKEEKKYGHLTTPKSPFGMQRWQKAAWWAAASEFRKPSYLWARLSVLAGWPVGLGFGLDTASPVIGFAVGLGTWGVLRLLLDFTLYGPYRRRVNKRAAELLVIFEESRRRSRRVPGVIRHQVLERDGHACVYCHATDDLHIDHIHPHSRGGLTDIANLQVLCGPCNIGKGVLPDDEARRRRTSQ